MSLMDVFVRIGADTSDLEDGVKKSKGLIGGLTSALGGVGSAVVGGMKVAGAAIGAATTAVSAFGGMAVKSYANYEQLVGGVDKLYGDASEKLQSYANEAYKTSGMSANQYMETATSFSAALINSLGGDVNKAADMTDVAMRAISDNVNVFGSDMESVTNAFQGFAKGNYTMLDNLKLGYGGTKEEMDRLIADANEYRASIGESADLSKDSFADIVQAIQSVQEAQNIAGTTNKEAMSTIEGSAAATKAAWENVITAIGRGEGLSEAFDSLASAVFGENEGEGLLNQIIPRIQTTMEGIGDFIATAAPFISEKFPELINAIVPSALEAGVQLLGAISDGIFQVLPTLMDTGKQLVEMLGQTLIENIPVMIPQIVELITQLAQMLADNADAIVAGAIQIITVLATSLLENAPTILNAIMQLATAAAEAILNNLPLLLESVIQVLGALLQALITWIPQFMKSFGEFNETILRELIEFGVQLLAQVGRLFADLLKDHVEKLAEIGTKVAEFGTKLWEKATEIASKFVENMMQKMGELPGKVMELGENMLDAIRDLPEKFLEIGSNIVQGLWDGISNATSWIKDKISGWVGDVLSFIKGLFGIASPSKVMRDMIGINLGKGVAVGIENSLPAVKDALDDMSDLVSEPEISPTVSIGNAGGFSNARAVLSAMEKEQNPNRNLTVILELERTQLARAVYALNNEETQRVGLNLAGGYA